MYEKFFEMPVKEGLPFPVTLSDEIKCAPFEEYLEMKIESSDVESTVLSMPFKVKHAQSKGFIHGGALTSLAHTTLAIAIKKQLPFGSDIEIITFSLRSHLPVKGGFVRAIGKIVEESEKDIRGEVLVCNSIGDKVATYSAVYRKNRVRKGV